MSKDPFQQLVDEITLIRGEVQQLRRSSLDKEEAEALHEVVAHGVQRMDRAASEAVSAASRTPETLRSALRDDRLRLADQAQRAAATAAEKAIAGVQGRLEAERTSVARVLSEAHRKARRHELRSWTWVGGLLATGALLGALTAYGTETAKSVLSVKDTVRVACEYALLVGGQRITQDSGWTYCAVPIEGPNGERP